jgi:hypothetical protein
MRFKQSPVRLHPGEQRGVSLLFDPARVPPGTPIEVATHPGVSLRCRRQEVPQPVKGGWSRVTGTLRALVSADAGSRLSVFAAAGEHGAELVVFVVRHHASGWVREIARKDDDSHIEAEFEPETGIVTVYEGTPEFKALECAARQAGLGRARVREYVPYRMLEVEVAANAVYWWAAARLLERRLPGERPADPVEYAAAVRIETQLLRHRAREADEGVPRAGGARGDRDDAVTGPRRPHSSFALPAADAPGYSPAGAHPAKLGVERRSPLRLSAAGSASPARTASGDPRGRARRTR